ncbi:methyltransferase [Clostridia bacterium]|nr:methyltransferase [Clostridia bacterium]
MYKSLARVYDVFMKDVPYEKWAENIAGLFGRYNVSPELVLELGCGTGNVTVPLALRGFSMIGVDISADMLALAQEKALARGVSVLFLNQDMREFELYGTVGACVSVCDCLNYIQKADDLTKIFKLVKNYLDDGGVFLFDLNTEAVFEYLGEIGSFGETLEDSAFICETAYDGKIMEYNVNIFTREKDENYTRTNEIHREYPHTLKEIKNCLESANLTYIETLDAQTLELPTPDTRRVYIASRA